MKYALNSHQEKPIKCFCPKLKVCGTIMSQEPNKVSLNHQTLRAKPVWNIYNTHTPSFPPPLKRGPTCKQTLPHKSRLQPNPTLVRPQATLSNPSPTYADQIDHRFKQVELAFQEQSQWNSLIDQKIQSLETTMVRTELRLLWIYKVLFLFRF